MICLVYKDMKNTIEVLNGFFHLLMYSVNMDKRAIPMVGVLDTILKSLPYPPRILFSDRGSEMTSREMVGYFKKRAIQQFISKQSTHAFQVE